jgi:elongation factor Tu
MLTTEPFVRGKRHVNVGMLGHEGHGKTAVRSALVRVQSKRMHTTESPAVAGAGVAVAELESAERHYAIVDCDVPHIAGMLGGTPRMDGAILVVSAPDSVMPQTREHAELSRRAGVSRIVVALNKCDEIEDAEMLDLVEMEVREVLAKVHYEDVKIVKVAAAAALGGDPKWEQAIVELVKALDTGIPDPTR